MESKLKLNQGDTLKEVNHRSKGPLAETDIYTYSIINLAREVIGTVEHTDHTSIKGFRRSQNVIQRDAAGNVIVEEHW